MGTPQCLEWNGYVAGMNNVADTYYCQSCWMGVVEWVRLDEDHGKV